MTLASELSRAAPNGATPLPLHADHLRMKFPGAPQPLRALLEHTFTFLCLVAYGDKDPHDLWELAHGARRSRAEWSEQVKPLTDRLATICILAGLLVSTTATFITTTPPMPSKSDYTAGAIYGCLLCSFNIILGGLAVGTIILFIMNKCDQNWFRKARSSSRTPGMHLSSRSRTVCLTIILAYPFLSIMTGIMLGALSLCVATIIAASTIFRIALVLVMSGPGAMLFLFIWMQVPSQMRRGRAGEEPSGGLELEAALHDAACMSGVPSLSKPAHHATV
ncbi:hypothetical protein K488DRAFT_75201 [Vararia minispora EC-137]|uniref:Uncharacterized protein n=1 Tax=Vararia minispora EC-137 TaxID=1314806 RepID=A0ACB8Q4N2_9AGAM|nr:hypothetical protein K488DRAFT_75201 [Vararia minispora EC-137]